MIIGLTGKNASGKGEVAKFLQERGFHFLSLSDVLREELRRRRMGLTRDHLTRVGNELREKYGPSVLAERILRSLTDSQSVSKRERGRTIPKHSPTFWRSKNAKRITRTPTSSP